MPHETHPHLERAPITEAILDISVETDARLEVTDAFAEKVAGAYPESSPVFAVEGFFAVTPGKSGVAGSKSNTIGRICWNAQKTRAVQARNNGFTVNHVKHYESWSALRSEAVLLWKQYLDVTQPNKVTRVALRYINRITVPAAGDLGLYMQTYPRLGQSLPQDLRNFFMRVEVPFAEHRLAIITQTMAPGEPSTGERGLILDVDAVTLKEFDPKDPGIWDELDQLREIKNTCFFGSLHEQTWRKYQ
jgi:uncharacterized protein (TIGR04255 family)